MASRKESGFEQYLKGLDTSNFVNAEQFGNPNISDNVEEPRVMFCPLFCTCKL
jgi:hypothetical protein